MISVITATVWVLAPPCYIWTGEQAQRGQLIQPHTQLMGGGAGSKSTGPDTFFVY